MATYARSCGIFNNHFTANLPSNLPVKKYCKFLRFDRIMTMSLWPHFLAHPVVKQRFYSRDNRLTGNRRASVTAHRWPATHNDQRWILQSCWDWCKTRLYNNWYPCTGALRLPAVLGGGACRCDMRLSRSHLPITESTNRRLFKHLPIVHMQHTNWTVIIVHV